MDAPKRYTEKQEAFLEALMGEAKGNLRKAMDIAGYAKTTKIRPRATINVPEHTSDLFTVSSAI